MWLIVASMIAGTWVGWEPLTGHKIPDYAHPVFGTILAAALVWGGIDLRKVSYWHKKLLALPPDVLTSEDADRLAPKIAALETDDPMLLRAIQASTLRDANLPIRPRKTTGGHRRTQASQSGVRAVSQSGGANPRPTTQRRNARNTPAPFDIEEG